jgi:hypothetical protein
MPKPRTFKPGDTVKYAPSFLASIHERPDSPLAKIRGTVQEVKPYPSRNFTGPARIVIRWSNDQTSTAIAPNITHA